MRGRLLIVIAAAALLWLALWIASALMRSALAGGTEHRWPLDLGTLSDVPARYPPTAMSNGGARLIALAVPLGINLAPRRRDEAVTEPLPFAFVRGQLDGWVNAQVRTATPHIEPLPSESGEYLAGRAADIAAISELLRSNAPVVWEQDIDSPLMPVPNLLGHMELHRVLVGRALDRAGVGDHGGWDDLRAAWHLSRSLTRRPELISNLIALAIARRVDAAARKMPLPAPDWLAGFHSFDFRRALIAAYQADAWGISDRVHAETSIDTSGHGAGPLVRRVVDAVMAPYTRMSASDMAEQWRLTAIEIAGTRVCDLDKQTFHRRRRASIPWWNLPARQITAPNLDEMWARLLRFQVEREATVRALALREGAPAQPQSACSDGNWIYSPDGRSFRFSRKMADPPVPASAMPLEFRLSADGD